MKKKVCILTISIFCFLTSLAQNPKQISQAEFDNNKKKFALNNVIVVNPFLDKYVGKWVWSSNDDLIEIVFEKRNIKTTNNGNEVTFQGLEGVYRHVVDGVEKPNDKSFLQNGTTFSASDPVVFGFRNKNKRVFATLNVKFVYLDSNTLKVTLGENVSDANKQVIPIPLDILFKRM